jgi:hypothetical protein
MDEPGFASLPDGLETHGVYTCIAVAYLNETRGEAALLHEAGMSCTNSLGAFLEQLQRKTSPSDVVRILIAGGNTEYDGDDDSGRTEVAKDRAYVKMAVKEAFPQASVNERWLDGASCEVKITTVPFGITCNVEAPPAPPEFDD